jgi:predicted porin
MADGDINESAVPLSDNTPGGQEDIFGVGVNFVESFNDVDVAVSGGYVAGSIENSATVSFLGGIGTDGEPSTTTNPTTNGDDLEQWNMGLNVGFAGFTVGGSYMQSNNATQNNGDTTTWDVGATYSTGPMTFGLTYLASSVEAGTGAGDDELDSISVSGTYNLGPGVDVWGGLKWYDYQSDSDPDAENEGWILAIGSTVSF